MAERFDLLVRGGTLVTSQGRQRADVGITGGSIAAIGDLPAGSAPECIDATGLHVLPGVIDSQVHLREPGNEHKEDLATGTTAAVLGGVCAVFEMPNTNPTTTTRAALDDKFARAKGRARCDVAFFVGAAGDNVSELAELERAPGCSGVKIFMGSSTGTLLVAEDDDVRRVLANGQRRVAVHSEDENRLRERKALLGDDPSVAMHPFWRDDESAILCTRRLIALSRETGRKVHVLHITTGAEMELLAGEKPRMSVEVTPQHLTLEAPDCYERLGSYAQMNPPIRAGQLPALWRAVADGVVDVIGSDHAPHTKEEKARPYPESPSGMPGVQTMVPIMLNHVHEGRLTLERFVSLLCERPAELYGAHKKGHLAVGFDGDLTLVDLQREVTLTHAMMASRCGWTPFDGMKVTGFPIATIVRGNVVMREGQLVGDAIGRPVEFAVS